MAAEKQLSPKQAAPPGSVFQIGTRRAALLGLGVFGFILLLGWGQPFSRAGLWAGLFAWAAIAGHTVRMILRTGRLNPYRLQFFTALALGTILAVLFANAPGAGAWTAPLPARASAAAPICHIALAGSWLSLVSNFFLALTGQGFFSDGIYYFLAALYLGFTFLLGTAWCSWACGYGAWDECFSRLNRRPPSWALSEPAGIWKYANLGLALAVVLAAWFKREAFFCLWICPFKLTEPVNAASPAGHAWLGFCLAAGGLLAIAVLPALTGRRFFCRHLCPFGAWQSLWGKLHPWRRVWSAGLCTFCARCQEVCPMQAISLSDTKVVIGAACNHCGRCEDACPAGALGIQWGTGNRPAGQGQRQGRLILVLGAAVTGGAVGALAWMRLGELAARWFLMRG